MTEAKADEAELHGGSAEDRARIMGQHRAYLQANASFDWPRLQEKIWTRDAHATYFNLNGHTYNGPEHWVRLWQYYADQVNTGEWIPYDIGGVVNGDLAVVWCHRKTKMEWVGTDPRPGDKQHVDRDFVSRSTMVFRKEDGDWRVVHVHFSEANDGERPGGI
ncbi:MAG: nuclear transport factor 2 family protein [Sneathiellaceae bacterium]